MSEPLDDRRLAEVLPGSWRIAATSQHSWLTGDRLAPHIDVDLHSRRPLAIVHRTRWQTPDGIEIESTSRSVRRGDTFSRRGSGKNFLQRSAWHVGGVDPSGSVITLHVTRSFEFLPGIDIIAREGLEPDDVRSVVANSTEAYGLTPGEFATLTWLPR